MVMRDDHTCTAACTPDFHPKFTPANEWGRQPPVDDTDGIEVGQIWGRIDSGRRIRITRVDPPFELRWVPAYEDHLSPHGGTLFTSTLRDRYRLISESGDTLTE